MEGDLNNFQLISFNSELDSSFVVGGRRGSSAFYLSPHNGYPRSGVADYQVGAHGHTGRLDPVRRRSDTSGHQKDGRKIAVVGDSWEQEHHGSLRGYRKNHRMLNICGDSELSEEDEIVEEDDVEGEEAKNGQEENWSAETSVVTFRRLLRRERALLRGCDAVCRQIGLMRESETLTPNHRPNSSARVSRVSLFDPESLMLRADKVTVHIRVLFLKIGEINTAKENFTAEIFVQAKWREPSLDGSDVNSTTETIDLQSFWNPNLFVFNTLGEPEEVVWGSMSFDGQGRAMIYEKRMIRGCFLENLELKEFPFDTQDLTLTLSSERTDSEIDFEMERDEVSGINVQSFCDEQEWQLHGHIETWKKVISRTYQTSESKHQIYSTACRASRRPGFFIWNVFLVMLFICSLAFTTFTVDLTLSQNRLLLSFFLLLTTVTFKFVVNQQLPRISYLTHLDQYVLTSMAMLCCVCTWHAIVPLLSYDLSLANKVDTGVLIVLGSVYFIYHIGFFLYIYFVAMNKRRTYARIDDENLRNAANTCNRQSSRCSTEADQPSLSTINVDLTSTTV